ncbi:glycosyltransferase family 4 protein [Candidatus Uhrbacteria bacterium]|nr:glycosyltransferase family 4 protein [Candidatus Uhrbacteria bacterium]
MKIAFIHNEKKLGTGAHFINDLIACRLRDSGVKVKNFYPKHPLIDAPHHLKGISNILFFYSLLEHKDEVLKYDIIQGTTYTPLAFLPFRIPVVSHFGSTSWGFLKAVPLAKDMDHELREIWLKLKKSKAIKELNVRTRRPLKDIAEIEKFVALRANAVIATSQIVKSNLLDIGVSSEKIHVVPNAIEDYWFTHKPVQTSEKPALIFLGRIGSDAFTLKLKGIDRLVDYYQRYPLLKKYTIGMTTDNHFVNWFKSEIQNHIFHVNLIKEKIPEILSDKAGSILLITSRYEGFSLSLVEGMSQGLIPITYPVGIAPEIIQNGSNGFIVTSQNEGKKVIEYILKLSKDDRYVLAQAARNTARAYASKAISNRLLTVYEETLKTKNRK